jgi:DNA-binding transcriptional LysR family regulator
VLEFLRRYPDMQVDLVTEGRLVDIVADGFDAGGRLQEAVPQDMIAVPCSPPFRTYMSEWGVSNELASGRLVRVLEDWTPPYPGLCVYYSGHRHMPAGLQAFIAVVRELTAPS